MKIDLKNILKKIRRDEYQELEGIYTTIAETKKRYKRKEKFRSFADAE